MGRIFTGRALVALLALPVASAEVSHEASLALLDLNSTFIVAHAAANELDLATGGPIILLRDGELVLVRNGTETAAPVIAPEYEMFKSFAHLPVAIYLLLGPSGEGQLDAARLDQLNGYRAKLDRVEDLIEQIGLTGDDLERQKRILTGSKQFLAYVAQRQQFRTEELYAFTRRMTPLIKANLAGAAEVSTRCNAPAGDDVEEGTDG